MKSSLHGLKNDDTLPAIIVTWMRYKLRCLVALSVCSWIGVILFLSLNSYSNISLLSEQLLGNIPDEIGHLGEYAILGLLTYSFLSFYLSKPLNMLISLILCGLFSLLDESFQSLNPNRTPEVKDIIFDNAGSTGAVFCAALLRNGFKRFYVPSVHSKF